MRSILSLLTVIILLICQRAAVLSGGSAMLLTLIAVHVTAIVLSVIDSLRRDGKFLPCYDRATAISDSGDGGGKAISNQHDDVLLGALFGGVCFGVPIVTQIFSEDSPWTTPLELVALTVVVVTTPVTLFVTWKRLRHVLWTLPVAALAYTIYRQAGF